MTQSVGAEVAVTGVAVNTDPPLAGTWRLSAMPVAAACRDITRA